MPDPHRKGDNMRRYWLRAVGFMAVGVVGLGLAWAATGSHVFRFADTLGAQPTPSTRFSFLPPEPFAPLVPAADWLQQQGWEQAWPKLLFGKPLELFFAGPVTQRFLRLVADEAYAVWSRRVDIDPQQWPALEITWAIERFPQEAALDVAGRNDRPITIVVSFGPKVPSGGLRPDVPRGLAFFWGETEQVGTLYTCIMPRRGPSTERLQCVYPHVKYIALRSGGAGVVHTDRVHLVEVFRQYFPEDWQREQRMPPIVALSFEARSDRTASLSLARLYTIAFTARTPAEGQTSEH
jgi:hypothetical protein